MTTSRSRAGAPSACSVWARTWHRSPFRPCRGQDSNLHGSHVPRDLKPRPLTTVGDVNRAAAYSATPSRICEQTIRRVVLSLKRSPRKRSTLPALKATELSISVLASTYAKTLVAPFSCEIRSYGASATLTTLKPPLFDTERTVPSIVCGMGVIVCTGL